MTHIKYHQITEITELKNNSELRPVYFLYGDPYLKRNSSRLLIEFIKNKMNHQVSIEVFQGDEINISTIVESLNTFSFLYPNKLILIKDMPLTDSNKKNPVLSTQGIESFTQCLKNGFPQNHFLIITTDSIDKRKAFYKTIDSIGIVIDCSIPEGSRYADIQEKTGIFRSIVQQKLSTARKSIQEDAFLLIIDRIGFDLDGVLDSVEKLISFTGDTTIIDNSHVRSVVKRIKKDPIFNFTNAIMDRNMNSCFLLFDSLIQNGLHPLQILAALTNQFRKTLFIKCFIESHKQKQNAVWQKNMNFNQFKQTALPVIIDFDKKNRLVIEDREALLGNKTEKKTVNSDLFLATQPQNAYPVYQAFLKSENYSLAELTGFVSKLSDLDFRLKSSSIDPKAALKNFITQTCLREN